MQVINAVWEKKNLGVDVTEINCSENDLPDELCEALNAINTSYSVVKIPSGSVNLLLEAQRHGYKVIEQTVELLGDINKMKPPMIYERFMPHIRLEEASDKALSQVLEIIKEGGVFQTDRIALDPVFSKEIAGRRYYNWSRDVLNNNGFMGVLYYKDELVAFNLSKPMADNQIYDGIVGGLLPGKANHGLGFLVVHAENEICKYKHGKYCTTRVSTNNLPILRLHLSYGYDIKKMTYVLIKHQ